MIDFWTIALNEPLLYLIFCAKWLIPQQTFASLFPFYEVWRGKFVKRVFRKFFIPYAFPLVFDVHTTCNIFILIVRRLLEPVGVSPVLCLTLFSLGTFGVPESGEWREHKVPPPASFLNSESTNTRETLLRFWWQFLWRFQINCVTYCDFMSYKQSAFVEAPQQNSAFSA